MVDYTQCPEKGATMFCT